MEQLKEYLALKRQREALNDLIDNRQSEIRKLELDIEKLMEMISETRYEIQEVDENLRELEKRVQDG
jgi:predicted  nucleic acid-binding Zn-ribbon protein